MWTIQNHRHRLASRLAISACLLFAGWSCGDSHSGGEARDGAAFDVPKDAPFGQDGNAAAVVDGGTMSIFEAWRELRSAIRTSPDHLVAQADIAVATGDAQAILDFVSRNIQTIPAAATSFAGSETKMLWGPRATLRGGEGTLRDKCELLAGLYQRAGFTTTVMSVLVDDSTTLGPRMLAPLVRPGFAPTLDPASLARWQDALGVKPDAAAPVTVLDHAQATSLAGSIASSLAGDAGGGSAAMHPAAFDWTSLRWMPLVQVMVHGTATWANPAVPNTKLGDVLSTGKPGQAGAASDVGTIHVKLEGATASRPADRVVLAEHTYSRSDLLGRQLLVSFVPALTPKQMFTSTVGSVDGFYPLLAVRGVDLTTDQTGGLAFSGMLINSSGDVATQSSSGAITMDGNPLGPVLSNADATTQVSSVVISDVNACSFPRIRVRAGALDASGQPVSGVPASAIAVTENGSPRPLVVLQNAALPPRVLFVLDTSDSMPAQFLGAEAASVVRSMATSLLAVDSRCQFAVAAVFGGLAGQSAWLTDPAALETAAAAESGFASDLWGALDAASSKGATAVVLITDGQADSSPADAELARIAAGPPAILLKAGTASDNSLQRMADITGGARFEVADTASAVTVVTKTIQQLQQAPLVFEYTAVTADSQPADASVNQTSVDGGGTQGNFILTIAKAPAVAGTYTAPANQVPARAWAGFYLTIDDGSQTVTRVLGGQTYPDDRAQVPQSAIDETRYSLFGQYVVSFEGGAPTLAEWLDDTLASKIALEGFWNASHGTSDDAILEALKQGLPYIPSELPALHTPLPAESDGTLTFETGVRAVLVCAYPHPTRGLVRHADILPFTQFATVGGKTPADNFNLTLARSSLLAIAEQQLYQESTAQLLASKALTAVVPYSAASPFPSLSAADRTTWDKRLQEYSNKIQMVPVDGSVPAFYVVDPATGSMLAILSDGSGGGLSASDQGLANATLKGLDLISAMGNFAGASFGFGAVIALQAAILKVVIAEAGMIASIGPDAQGTDPFGKAACGLACDLAKGAISVPVPIFGQIEGGANVGGSGISCGCP
jgi:hypothetical protein